MPLRRQCSFLPLSSPEICLMWAWQSRASAGPGLWQCFILLLFSMVLCLTVLGWAHGADTGLPAGAGSSHLVPRWEGPKAVSGDLGRARVSIVLDTYKWVLVAFIRVGVAERTGWEIEYKEKNV